MKLVVQKVSLILMSPGWSMGLKHKKKKKKRAADEIWLVWLQNIFERNLPNVYSLLETTTATSSRFFFCATMHFFSPPHTSFLWLVFYNLGSISSTEKCPSLLLSPICGQCLAQSAAVLGHEETIPFQHELFNPHSCQDALTHSEHSVRRSQRSGN